ncbi:TonB family protein [Sulfuricaulis limicola]|uniref:TonB family protein n=1 Tax=Sulfuricaulis limicola TaxID=1620215 RepID=UPI000BBA562F|nr:TonB family protein [Sulfuricaulis limicola]
MALTRFLALSIALHLCLLAGFGQTLPSAPNLRLGQSVLNVQLQNDAPSPVAVNYSGSTTAIPAAKSSGDHAAAPVEAVASSSPADPATGTGVRPSAPTIGTRAGQHNQLLGELRTRLSRYLTYPPLARSRGWEGTVWLSLRVESDGQLDKIRLERSSGYAVLDNSALNSLQRIGNLVEARVWLEGRGVDMQLPVIYRLIEN